MRLAFFWLKIKKRLTRVGHVTYNTNIKTNLDDKPNLDSPPITEVAQGETKMSNITKSEALKEIRAKARSLGMTFKEQNARINRQQAYQLTDRKSGRVLAQNFTIWCAYEDIFNGYFDKVAKENKCIDS